MTTYALVDCNAFYCSCERDSQPALKRVPVVVLSNNDGCVIARSADAKELGIPMGAPYYQVRDQLASLGIAVRSSNYVLYADMSHRVMSVLASMVPTIEVYSIDEAFCDLTGIQEDLTEFGTAIRQRLLQWVGIPVGVGIGSTKTLAKLANWAAKKWPATGGVVDLRDPLRQQRLLKLAPATTVWGVGRRLGVRLAAMNIHTAWDLAQCDPAILRMTFGVTVERTGRELNGQSCLDMHQAPPAKKAICTSKMFGYRLSELEPIREAMATYVTRAAEKLRSQASLCGGLQVSLQTQRHDPGQPIIADAESCILAYPTDDTRDLIARALSALERIFKPGVAYSKCAVMLFDLSQRGELTSDLFAPAMRDGSDRLMGVIDRINKREGAGTLRFARVPVTPKWGMRSEMRSRCYTTRWDELIQIGS